MEFKRINKTIRKMKFKLLAICCLSIIVFSCKSGTSTSKTSSKSKLNVLIIDGENNHTIWPKSTLMIKDYLEYSASAHISS